MLRGLILLFFPGASRSVDNLKGYADKTNTHPPSRIKNVLNETKILDNNIPKTHRCEKCKLDVDTAQKLKIHDDKFHTAITCGYGVCGLIFHGKLTYQTHVNKTHLKQNYYSCAFCSFESSSAILVRTHYQNIHRNQHKQNGNLRQRQGVPKSGDNISSMIHAEQNSFYNLQTNSINCYEPKKDPSLYIKVEPDNRVGENNNSNLSAKHTNSEPLYRSQQTNVHNLQTNAKPLNLVEQRNNFNRFNNVGPIRQPNISNRRNFGQPMKHHNSRNYFGVGPKNQFGSNPRPYIGANKRVGVNNGSNAQSNTTFMNLIQRNSSNHPTEVYHMKQSKQENSVYFRNNAEHMKHFERINGPNPQNNADDVTCVERKETLNSTGHPLQMRNDCDMVDISSSQDLSNFHQDDVKDILHGKYSSYD